MTTRIKICGITRPQDAALAAELGADAVGLNFFAGPRKITLRQGHEILVALPALITPVALTSGPTDEHPDAPTVPEIRAGFEIRSVPHPLAIETFQIYGTGLLALPEPVPPEIKLWAVYHFTSAEGLSSAPWRGKFDPQLIVVDKATDGKLGGTGQTLNWAEIGRAQNKLWYSKDVPPIVLAGGLTPENVAEAIRLAHPYAVDVSSGVEVAGKPGVKDPIKMRDFIQAAKGA